MKNIVLDKENSIFITVKEASKLLKLTERAIQKNIVQGKLEAIEDMNSCGGRNGTIYKIPLSSLPIKKQREYLKNNIAVQDDPVSLVPIQSDKSSKSFRDFTDAERKEIALWKDIVNQWNLFRDNFNGNKTDADRIFILKASRKHVGINISVGILYARWSAIKSDDLEALIDNRNKWKKGTHSYDSLIREVFEYYYLDESRHPVTRCREYVMLWCERFRPDLANNVPSYITFKRMETEIPVPYVKYFRYGEKAFEDQCLPYINRIYDDLECNDIWVPDGHTFDVITMQDGQEVTHRLHLVAFLDVRSRKFVGYYITPTLTAEAVLFALRKGIEKYGIPREIYSDNGREFLCYDIGGRGHRKTASVDFTPTPILQRLGIEFRTAEVRNAKAKVIERHFREVKDSFSRLFSTFTGGNVLEKPHRLNKNLKNGDVIVDSDFMNTFEVWLEGYWHERAQFGKGMNGKSPNQVFAENYITKRMAIQEDLDMLLMRSTRSQKVKRNGVKLDISGLELWYMNDELYNLLSRDVFVRYNPEDLREVRVYSAPGEKFLMSVPSVSEIILNYGADKEAVKEAKREINHFYKSVKKYNIAPNITKQWKVSALDLILWKAKQNLETIVEPEAKVIEPVRANENTNETFRMAVGHDPSEDDGYSIKRMVENSKKRYGLIGKE